MADVTERFLRYVAVDTQSEDGRHFQVRKNRKISEEF